MSHSLLKPDCQATVQVSVSLTVASFVVSHISAEVYRR